MTKVYPFLLATVPTLNFAGEQSRTSIERLGDLVFLLAVTLLATLRRVYAPAALAPLAAAAAPRTAASYAAVRRMPGLRLPPSGEPLAGNLPHPPHWLLVPGLCSPSSRSLIRGWSPARGLLDRIGPFLTLMARCWWRSRSSRSPGRIQALAPMVRDSRLLASWRAPIPGPAEPPGPRRDIYLIVLDEYANSAVLRERFGYDNRPFEDSLRALGFHVPRLVRSNYAHTLLSIPSLLNAAHLTAPGAGDGAGGTRIRRSPNHLVEQSRVAELLQAARATATSSSPRNGGTPRAASPQADVEPQVWDGFALMRAMGRTALQRRCEVAMVPQLLRPHPPLGGGPRAPHAGRHGATWRGSSGSRPHSSSPTSSAARALRRSTRECRVPPRQREDDYTGSTAQIECLNRLLLADGAGRSGGIAGAAGHHPSGRPRQQVLLHDRLRDAGGPAAGRPGALRRVRRVLPARRRRRGVRGHRYGGERAGERAAVLFRGAPPAGRRRAVYLSRASPVRLSQGGSALADRHDGPVANPE